MSGRLWHRTCTDAAAAIRASRVLRPNHHPLLGASLVWLADRPDRSRASLGLTSRTLTCDRMAVLFSVDTDDAVPWSEWCRANGIRPGLLGSGDPRCWWVSTVPLVVP